MEITIKDDYYKFRSALKLCGLVDSGVDAKFVIRDVRLKSTEKLTQGRGKKLYAGDTFEI